MKQNNFKIITPFYNPGKFLDKCIMSVMTQKYDNYKVIFIDDTSTDGSWEKLPHDNDKAICIKNTVRKTALENIHDTVMNFCEPDDIITIVDGDDWLSNNKVLEYLNNFYNEHDCWTTWGQAIWTSGRKGIARPVNKEDFKKIRTDYNMFFVSHLRTYRAGVHHCIKDQDPTFECMKDRDGKFYRWAYDTGLMLPILELSGYDRSKYIDKVLYIYNRDNDLSEDKINQTAQTGVHLEVLTKKPFQQIENYK